MGVLIIKRGNALSNILGIAGISIDVLCDDENAKLYIRDLWKYHLKIQNLIKEKEEAQQRKDFENLMFEFHRNNSTRFGFSSANV